jgi:hypothetical protein
MKKYVSYKDDDEEETVIRGFFEVLEENNEYIKIQTGNNKIKIPTNRLLKVKEK